MGKPAVAEESKIQSVLGGKPRFSAIVKIYSASGGAWAFTGLVGAINLVADTSKKSWFLRFVDLDASQIKWEQELYNNFIYKNPKPFFHTLETDDSVVGFSFADIEEANELLGQIFYAKSSPVTSNTATASKPTPAPIAKPKKEEKKKEKKKGFFSRLFGSDESEVPKDFVLSGPTNFQHKSHIGWDPSKGFEVDNIPADWKKLFQQAGIKKSELRDAETAKYVMGVLNEAIAAEQIEAPPMDNAPMPPGSGAGAGYGAAPAPPVPTAPPMMVGGGPPPPPPPPPAGGGPPPPRPPPTSSTPVAPPPPSTSSMPSSGGGDERGGLLSQIRGGAALRKVDPNAIPDLKSMDENKTHDLASVLASAMKGRRLDMNTDEAGDDNDDEWSD